MGDLELLEHKDICSVTNKLLMLEFCLKAVIQGILVFLGISIHLNVHLSLFIQLLFPRIVLDAVNWSGQPRSIYSSNC